MPKLPFCLLIALPAGLLAQVPDPLIPPPTQLENFLLQKGTLIVQETNRIGHLERKGSQIQVDGIVARFVVRRGDPAKGLRLTVPSGAKFSIDAAELDFLLRAMLAMENHFQNWQENSPNVQQDMFFTTKSAFEISLHYQEGTVVGEAGGPVEKGFSSIELDLDGLREFRRLLEQANAWLISR